jgi:hypothetical protein
VLSRLTTYYKYAAALYLRQQLGAGKAMPEYKPAKPHCAPVLMVRTLAPRPKGRVASAREHVVKNNGLVIPSRGKIVSVWRKSHNVDVAFGVVRQRSKPLWR